MPSLSSYDRGKKAMEGRRVIADIESGKASMEILLGPLKALQRRQKEAKKRVYTPRMVFCLGNHENRIARHVESNPELDGSLSFDDLGLEAMGWEVIPFLQPIVIDGIAYAHYFYNPMSGRPYGGAIENKMSKVKTSFTMGHQQGLQIATATNNAGTKMWGLVAGSFYQHFENYIGPQGNDHWRGIVMKHNVNNGDYSPCIVNMDYLLENYL